MNINNFIIVLTLFSFTIGGYYNPYALTRNHGFNSTRNPFTNLSVRL